MIQYIARRLLVLPLIVLLVTLILFFLMLQIPPDVRAEAYLGTMGSNTTPEEAARIIQHVIEHYGLDRPFLVQYANWIRRIAVGDWGFSPTWRQPILEALLRRIPASAELALLASVPAIALSLSLGALAARRRGRTTDALVRTTAFVGWAFPPFILGLILLNVLYAWLGWFPPERLGVASYKLVEVGNYTVYTGMLTVDSLLNGNPKLFLEAMRHLVLPAFTLGFAQWALLTRVMRSSMLQVLNEDYITTARAKGLPERIVLNRHARRNAVLPVISTGGVVVSLLFSGVVVVEAVFDFEGIGHAAVEAMLAGDVMAVVGFTLFTCIFTVLSSLVTDILYALVDPRVGLFRGSKKE